MSIKSMTGFGSAQEETPISRLEVSIKTVNGRFLETRFHLPRELMDIEVGLKKSLQKLISRGTVDVFVSRQLKPEASSAQVSLNKKMAAEWISVLKDLRKMTKEKSPLSLDTLSRLPDIFQIENQKTSSEGEKKLLEKTFEKALGSLDKERKREGESIKKDILSLVSQMTDHLTSIKSLRDEANTQLFEKTRAKIQSRLAEFKLDENRLVQEVAVLVDRSDINEELVRLHEHLMSFKKILDRTEPMGKQLDFFTQEILREINTVGSKTQVAKLTEVVVQAKTVIERIKEQVQNIE